MCNISKLMKAIRKTKLFIGISAEGANCFNFSRILSDFQVRLRFRQALKNIGLDQPRRVIGNVNFLQPTPHSLRHSFAVGTLFKIKQRGESAQKALPVLAAYMGHRIYIYTSVYLRVADALSRKQLVDFTLWQEKKE